MAPLVRFTVIVQSMGPSGLLYPFLADNNSGHLAKIDSLGSSYGRSWRHACMSDQSMSTCMRPADMKWGWGRHLAMTLTRHYRYPRGLSGLRGRCHIKVVHCVFKHHTLYSYIYLATSRWLLSSSPSHPIFGDAPTRGPARQSCALGI